MYIWNSVRVSSLADREQPLVVDSKPLHLRHAHRARPHSSTNNARISGGGGHTVISLKLFKNESQPPHKIVKSSSAITNYNNESRVFWGS